MLCNPYIISLVSGVFSPSAQEDPEPPPPGTLPLCRVSLFSSGVGFFEHTGTLRGPADLSLPFAADAVNDALKSLTINDPGSSPSVSYPSEQTLPRTLQSLSVDVLGNPSLPKLLNSLKGAEIEASLPNPVQGRIIFVEYRRLEESRIEPYLSLYTEQGIKVIALGDLGDFRFKDPALQGDLHRALDLIMQSRDADTRRLRVRLEGESEREVALSYVIPTPIWKVSYRLDLSQEPPLLQGWAIVDNDGDTDWENVELSLVTGRPVSFIQNLYAPYHLSRPVIPLAIAGFAPAETYDSGRIAEEDCREMDMEMADEQIMTISEAQPRREVSMAMKALRPAVRGGFGETAQGRAAGEQFEFTIKKPVSLPRRQSAMLPLVEGTLPGRKTLVFSGGKARRGYSMNPAICVELTNTTGMKLPAGPVTVYDAGTYAGDALIAFFPEGEKRLIAYGEDLSVTGCLIEDSAGRRGLALTMSRGLMSIKQKAVYTKVYSFRNASGQAKRLVVEHPIRSDTTLMSPAGYDEKTDTLYRFVQTLPERGTLDLTVQEERPVFEEIILSELDLPSLVSYTADEEIAPMARQALQGAVALKRETDAAEQRLQEMTNRREGLIAAQERTRQNLSAAGNQSPQGQDYLKRLAAQEGDIDALDQSIAQGEQAVRFAQQEYDEYLAGLVFAD